MEAESCPRRAWECMFRPGMNAEVKEMIAAWETCRKYEKSQPNQPLMPLEIPSRPWERIGVDLFTFDNKDFLITVNYFSNYWETDKLNNTLASTVILKPKSHFVRYGCFNQVVSDNEPQFDCLHGNPWLLEHTHSRDGLKPSTKAYELAHQDSVAKVQSTAPAKNYISKERAAEPSEGARATSEVLQSRHQKSQRANRRQRC